MNTMREQFEAWHAKEFGWCNAETWLDSSEYCDSDVQKRWLTWNAALASVSAGRELDADAEMEKVKRDVELMGVGFLVDGKRCSLDRITWFNRASETDLPPMQMTYVQAVPSHCDRITWRGAYYHLKEGAEAARQVPAVAVIRQAILDYYDDLTARKHGGVAMDKAFNKIQVALGICWQDEALIKRSATTQGDKQ